MAWLVIPDRIDVHVHFPALDNLVKLVEPIVKGKVVTPADERLMSDSVKKMRAVVAAADALDKKTS